ncbi:MAG: hypothetical protein KatS3mg111_3312 [Pirellulaceae bacterium]|nr:MAG: hypothetical protein KatS3mg111_3312 [Pirellulaceae bacterium]
MKRIKTGLVACVLMVAGTAGQVWAQEGAGYSPPAFGNWYTNGEMNRATAPLYVSPLPVPQWVGHTYITYQPFYPHEFMHHAHGHRYHTYYDNGRGLNRTAVRYSVAPFGALGRGIVKAISRPRP